MNIQEYNKIKDMKYGEYCDYLQQKYGIGKYDYMTRSWNRNTRSSRTSEGLVAHHKYEDRAIMLSTKEFAQLCPFEWQQKENLVYCNYLEHLLLHIMICEQPSDEKIDFMEVGIGGASNFLIPELNDVYSGFVSNQTWRKNCYDVIIDDKELYLILVQRFKCYCECNKLDFDKLAKQSYNEPFGLWLNRNNQKLYDSFDV